MAEPVVVSKVLVGSISVEMLATQDLSIHGSRASRPVNVSIYVIE